MSSASSVPHLSPSSVQKRAPWQDSEEIRVSNWIQPWDFASDLDAGIMGAPYSKASISASGAAGGPEAVRMALKYNTTYSPDWDTDIQPLAVRDLGDISSHLTDLTESHQRIENAVAGATALRPFIPIVIGGDHSVTAPSIRGFARGRSGNKIGVINFDAHTDVRNFEHGYHNGTPFRQIIENEPHVDAKNLVEIGIHGFMNSHRYVQWIREQGGRVTTGLDVQRRGMRECVLEALEQAADGTDVIYVSVDIDCLAYPWTIGTSSASPEGLSAWQLLEGVYACGLDERVGALDIVEIDPTRDVSDLTARSGCSVLLTFLAGLQRRINGDRGY